ncbi:MAG: phosphoribosyltransferase [Nitrososphaeria archaeon]|nr:phosphoribosyltransferase [Nitrososphaeria archaeon]
MEYITPSWNDIFEMCVEGASRIIDMGIKFDLIVTLSRGGLVPARIMSDFLEINDVIVLDVKYYTGFGKRSDKPIIREISQVLVNSKNVLLVDDVVDSGESLKAAVEYIKGLNPKCLKVFTLHVKPNRVIDPDIYVSETSAWIIYPWELFECYKELKANGVDVRKIFEANNADTGLLDRVIQFYDKKYRG